MPENLAIFFEICREENPRINYFILGFFDQNLKIFLFELKNFFFKLVKKKKLLKKIIFEYFFQSIKKKKQKQRKIFIKSFII